MARDRATFALAPRTRRRLLRNALVASGALLLPSFVPTPARAEDTAVCWCGHPRGPIHRWLEAYGVSPSWQHDIVLRESAFDPGATNPYSSAAGLAQFLWSTWRWGEERFGIYGSPYDWETNLLMFNAFLLAGEPEHWACTVESGCAG
jgi:soluble lytic murein transglycosylase-like protein